MAGYLPAERHSVALTRLSAISWHFSVSAISWHLSPRSISPARLTRTSLILRKKSIVNSRVAHGMTLASIEGRFLEPHESGHPRDVRSKERHTSMREWISGGSPFEISFG